MIRTIDVLTVQKTQYGVLYHFTRKLFEALERAGFSCRLLEGDDMLNVCCSSPPDLTIGFNGVVFDQNKNALCDLIQRPHLSILVDPPYRFLNLTESPFMILGCEDQNECDFLQRMGFDQTFFLPHAVEREVELPSHQNKTYDVVFLGTCLDSEARMGSWKKAFPSDVCEVMTETVALAFSDPLTSFLTTFFRLWLDHTIGGKATHLQNSDFTRILCEIELAIKGKERLDLISSIREASVHVFGGHFDKRDWKTLLSEQKNVVIHPPLSYTEAIEVMKQARIVLNTSLKNSFGAHERVFGGMAAGAVVVTSINAFLQRYYIDGKSIVYYQPRSLTELNHTINELIKHEPARMAIADEGRLQTLSHHTWDHRVQTIIKELTHCLNF
jgi:hypothetical protein